MGSTFAFVRVRLAIWLWLAAPATLLFAGSGAAGAAACDRPAVTVRRTTAYRTPPTFVTGRGLVFGEAWGALPANLRVFVCGSTKTGFGFSTQTWTQIAYFTEQRAGRFGWVPEADLRLAGAPRTAGGGEARAVTLLAIARPAHAGPGPSPATGLGTRSGPRQEPDAAPAGDVPRVPRGVAPPPDRTPPPPPAPPQTMGGGGVEQEGPLAEFYVWSFVAVIVGMAARVGQDTLESEKGKNFRTIAREMLTPLFVSPIVFLGFMQTAKVIVTDLQGYIVLLLLAFQSGFFWQTVINARKPKTA
jgi:hypothetical protein